MKEVDIVAIFKAHHFRATPQRIAVYGFLCDNPIHPTADTVYQNVLRHNPSFSKTTVYKALQALEAEGLVMQVKIDSHQVRYDATVACHGHFRCAKCGEIYDFPVEQIRFHGLENFEISRQDVYFTGVCPACTQIQ